MKNLLLFIAILLSVTVESQNTFPLNGNVGIGTLSPSEELEVIGTVKAGNGVFDNASGVNLQLGTEWSAGRRNFEFWTFDQSSSTETSSQFVVTDIYGITRTYFNYRGNRSYYRFNDSLGREVFKIDEGALGEDKVFVHLPRPNSRIVIGTWGSYLPEHKFVVKNGSAMIEGNILTNNNVGIGTNTFIDGTDTYRLSVNGKVRAHAVKVYTSWADFVFEDEYKLPKLNEVEEFIKQNGHLKDIPSAKEVEENGIELGEMNKLLLQKIEELTLYTIGLKKEIEELKAKNDEK